MKLRELVRMCAEAGAVKELSERPLGRWHATPILGDLDLGARLDLARGGGDTEVSNHARVGLSGYMGQQMTQAMGHMQVVAEDCGAAEPAWMPAERLGRWAEGAVTVATPAEPEAQVLDRGAVERLRKAGGVVGLRTPAGCGAPEGVCAQCCGHLEGRGGLAEAGTHLGDLGATAINEGNTQPVISAFHADSCVVEVKRGLDGAPTVQSSTEALLDAMGGEGKGLSSVYDATRSAGATPQQAACEVAAALLGETERYGIQVDPALVRILGASLVDRDHDRLLGLEEAAAKRAPAQYMASGSPKGRRALARFAQVVVEGRPLVTSMGEARQRAAVMERAEGRRGAPDLGEARAEALGSGWEEVGPDGRKGAWRIGSAKEMRSCLEEAPGTLFEPDTRRAEGPRPLDRLLCAQDGELATLARAAERSGAQAQEAGQGQALGATH